MQSILKRKHGFKTFLGIGKINIYRTKQFWNFSLNGKKNVLARTPTLVKTVVYDRENLFRPV